MDEIGYILDLYNVYETHKIPIHLNQTKKELLRIMTTREFFSAYDCHKEIQKYRKIAYKNVHSPIQELCNDGFIKKITQKNTKHNAVYYKLTTFGLFYIILNGIPESYDLRKLFTNHKILKFYIYRFLEEKTVEKIESPRILRIFFNFIKRIYLEIQEQFEFLKWIKKGKHDTFPLITINQLLNTNTKYSREDLYFVYENPVEFIDYLKHKFKIRWLNYKTCKIIEIEKDKTIQILDNKNNHLTLELDYKNKNAILLYKESRLFEFELRKIVTKDEKELFCLGNSILWLKIGDFISEKVIKNVNNFFIQKIYVEVFLELYRWLEYIPNTNNFLYMKKIENIKLLSTDPKFKKTFQQIKNNLTSNLENYEKFMTNVISDFKR